MSNSLSKDQIKAYLIDKVIKPEFELRKILNIDKSVNLTNKTIEDILKHFSIDEPCIRREIKTIIEDPKINKDICEVLKKGNDKKIEDYQRLKDQKRKNQEDQARKERADQERTHQLILAKDERRVRALRKDVLRELLDRERKIIEETRKIKIKKQKLKFNNYINDVIKSINL